ncbi:MAG: periplasmic heavy metal sensor [Paludibacteraceae bacterium]|nr:periplasmic heavy metal sensor [Paludibacteraceae bacterium]
MKKIMMITCLLAVSIWAMADGEDPLYKAYLDSLNRVNKTQTEQATSVTPAIPAEGTVSTTPATPLTQEQQDSIAEVKRAERAAMQARMDSINELRKARMAAAQAYSDSLEAAERNKQRRSSVANDTNDSIRQIDRFTIGVRGGAASMLQKLVNEDAKSQFGFDVLLDLQYAHYWLSKKEHKVGLLTGLSFGLAQGGLKAPNSVNQYTVTDPDGMKADYTVTADNIKERDRQLQVEVPLMFSLITKKGFFFNLGPRFFLPVYTPYKATLENPYIDAYFEQTDVHVTNEVITGVMKDKVVTGKGTTDNKLKLNITLGTELGYEWEFKNKQSLGLGVYANYGLYSMFKQDAQDLKSLITVTPAIPSTVTTNSATEAWTEKQGFVDVGIKLAYHFNWWKTKARK